MSSQYTLRNPPDQRNLPAPFWNHLAFPLFHSAARLYIRRRSGKPSRRRLSKRTPPEVSHCKVSEPDRRWGYTTRRATCGYEWLSWGRMVYDEKGRSWWSGRDWVGDEFFLSIGWRAARCWEPLCDNWNWYLMKESKADIGKKTMTNWDFLVEFVMESSLIHLSKSSRTEKNNQIGIMVTKEDASKVAGSECSLCLS